MRSTGRRPPAGDDEHRCAVLGGAVLDDLRGAVGGAPLCRQRVDPAEAGLPHVDDALDHGQVGEVLLAGDAGRVVEVDRLGALGQRRRLDQTHVAQVEVVHDLARIGDDDRPERALVAPPPEERVALDDPEQRADAGLLQAGCHDHREVQTGADPLPNDLAGGAHLLAGVLHPTVPAGRRVGVGDAQALEGLVHGSHDVVDPLDVGLVALDGRATRAGLEDAARGPQHLRHLGAVRHHVRRQHLQAEADG